MSAERGPRQSLLLPIAIPVGALVLIGAALFGFSRVLLRVSHTAATVTALIAAAGIMVIASLVASRKEVGATSLLSLAGGVIGVAMLAGGGALLLGQPEEEVEAVELALAIPEGAATAGFAETELTAPAGAPLVIHLTSEDPVLHNVDVAPGEGETPFVTGPDLTGPGEVDVPVDALDVGEYFYFCKYHPTTMKGTLTVEEGAPTPGEGGGGPTVVASGIAFDTDRIELPADQPSSLTLRNEDAGATHNIAIFTDDSASNVIWDGPDVIGPNEIVYDVPPIEAGDYYFHCDTHPTMSGTVAVAGKEPEGGGGGPPPEESGSPSPSG